MKVNRIHKAKFSSLTNRISLACLPVLSVVAALSPTPARAQFVWNSTGGNWSTDLNWNPAVVPFSDPATQLTFEASGDLSYTVTNDIGAGTFILNRITVNHTGTGTLTINGLAPANTFTFDGVDPTLDITGNALFNGLLVGSNSSVIRKTGSGTFIHDSNNAQYTGTLIVDGGTFMNRSTTFADTNFNPVSIIVNSGATYQFGLNGAGNPNLPNTTYITANPGGTVVWQEGEDTGGFHLQGGTLVMQANINANGSVAQNWTSGIVTGSSTVTANSASINKTGADTVFVTGNASIVGTGSLNIREGTVSIASIPNLGTTNVSLGGTTAGSTSGKFLYEGATTSRGGNFTINAGNGVIEIGSATTILTLTGAISGTGGLTKAGPGKLRVAGSLGAAGNNFVNAGILQVEPATALGGFSIASGAVLAVNSGVGLLSFATPKITFANDSVLQFDLNTSAPITAPLAIVGDADGVVINGTPTLRITNAQATPNGTYTLLDYSGAPITSGFNFALPGRTTGSLNYDTANTKIDVTITGTDTVKWTGGVNGDWDIGTGAGVGGTNNWKLVTAGTPTNFIQTDSLTFDDTATRFDLNLAGSVQPATMAVNATSNYTFSGPGKLSGPMALNKFGLGTLTLGTDNEYTGGTFVAGGILQLGNGGTTGSVTGPVTLAGGMLGFKHSNDLTFSNVITFAGTSGFVNNGTGVVTFPALNTGTNSMTFGGSGTLYFSAPLTGTGTYNKEGTGTMVLVANNNPFTGTLNINGGTVALEDFGASGDLGARAIVINNGGTFQFGANGNTDLPDTTILTINAGGLVTWGQGENYGGFLLNGGEFRMVSTGKTGVNSTAVATVAVYDLRSGNITTDITSPGSGGALSANNGGALVKTTSGLVTISGGVTFQAALPVQIKEGTLAMGIGNVPTGGSGMFSLGDATTHGTMQINGPGGGDSMRPFTLNAGGGTIRVEDSMAQLSITGIISGAGALTKTGDGTLVLNGANDYAGGTVVTAGRLELNNIFGSGVGSGVVTIGGTLSGTGAIITAPGNAISITGTFQPGFTGAMIGVDFGLTAGSGASTTFGAESVTRLDLWTSTGLDQTEIFEAADRLLVSGDLNIVSGAVLKLTNPNGLTFLEGDKFRLFDWSTAGVVTGTWALDYSEINLGSGFVLNTDDLYTAGTISVTAVPEPGSAVFLMVGLAACFARRRRSTAVES